MQIKFSNEGDEPITLADFKAYAKIDFTDEDSLITSMITGVREQLEEYLNRSLVVKTIEYFDEVVDDVVVLPYPNHDIVDEVKINGVVTDGYSKTGLNQFIITPNQINGFSKDITNDDSGFYCKYTTTGECPQAIKTEMKRLLLEQHEMRGNTFVGSVAELSENTYSNLMKFVIL